MNAVCLPKQGKEFQKDQAVKIAGWGDTESKNPKSKPEKLLTTDLLLTDSEECAKIFSKGLKKVEEQYSRFKDFICASYKGKRDACQGDSGGAMLEYADGRAVAVGIVSYGKGCATKGVPGVYERVSSLLPWIKDITKNKNKASVYFTMLSSGKEIVTKKKPKDKNEDKKKDGLVTEEKKNNADERADKKDDRKEEEKSR